MSDLEPSLPERAVARLAATLDRSRPSRRSFFAKAAIAGSALATKPWTYLVHDAAAYDVVCGAENECSDGWTAFCCTVSGSNSCPPGSYPAGWWKADSSGFCCGSARYYIDCNQTCGGGDQEWQCHCASGTCDRRRVACNQFRYGQCHQEIACYGPVVCRVITCQPPWQWDPSCTTSSATDNRTASHSAPCLDEYCWSSVETLWNSLGGAGGVLGNRISPQQEIRPLGARTLFQRGAIFQWNTHINEVHGSIWALYNLLGAQTSVLRYPTSDTRNAARGGTFSTFESGVIYSAPGVGTHEVHGSILAEWTSSGRESGPLGFPTSNTSTASRGATFNDFESGAIYSVPGLGTHEVHGSIFTEWDALGREKGPLGFPTSDTIRATRGASYTRFETGAIYTVPRVGTSVVRGAIFAKWDSLGRERGPLGFPAGDTTPASRDGGTFNDFVSGAIYSVPGLGTFEVHGAIFAKWDSLGRERGRLGYPVADTKVGFFGERSSLFEHGRITFDPATGAVRVDG